MLITQVLTRQWASWKQVVIIMSLSKYFIDNTWVFKCMDPPLSYFFVVVHWLLLVVWIYFWEWLSLGSTGCLQIPKSASVSTVLGLQAYATKPGCHCIFLTPSSTSGYGIRDMMTQRSLKFWWPPSSPQPRPHLSPHAPKCQAHRNLPSQKCIIHLHCLKLLLGSLPQCFWICSSKYSIVSFKLTQSLLLLL